MTFVRSANYYTTDPETYIVALIVVFYTRERERERERESKNSDTSYQVPTWLEKFFQKNISWKSKNGGRSLGTHRFTVFVVPIPCKALVDFYLHAILN
jgi:hypothetical protein